MEYADLTRDFVAESLEHLAQAEDVLDATVKLQRPAADRPCLVGSAIIQDRLTAMLDMAGLLRVARETEKTWS